MNNRFKSRKTVIPVPFGIRYLSSWPEFRLEEGVFILNKAITGCGYTEFCLRDPNTNVVLCSPRKILLQNKKEQHGDSIHYASNDKEYELQVDMDLESQIHTKVIEEDPEDEGDSGRNYSGDSRKETFLQSLDYLKALEGDDLNDLKQGVRDYLLRRAEEKQPAKIVVTYDSFRYVKELLQEVGIMDRFFVIVDEFQSIFTDAAFKSEVEFRFVYDLKDLPNVCFVSATPMMEEYLRMSEDFCELPYVELDWVSEDPTRVVKPFIEKRPTKRASTPINRIIKKYKEGKFKKSVVLVDSNTGEQKIVESREVVFYLNSVTSILSIIKNNGLKPEEVNILCSNNSENQSKIQKVLGTKYGIGTVPIRGESHKMFTFCTRTVYLGADFYSTSARTVIISNASVETMTVDISLDLPQIMGRQRLAINPWRNKVEFYFNTDLYKGDIAERGRENINKKIKSTDLMLSTIEKSWEVLGEEEREDLLSKYEEWRNQKRNTKDYASLLGTRETGKAYRNDLARIADERALHIFSNDYLSNFTVFNAIHEAFGEEETMSGDEIRQRDLWLKASEFNDYIDNITVSTARLELLCNPPEDLSPEVFELALTINCGKARPDIDLFLAVDRKTIIACSFLRSRLEKLMNLKLAEQNGSLMAKITDRFKVGDVVSLRDCKQILGEIYEELNIDLAPTAKELERYLGLKEVKITITTDRGSKRARAYEVLSILPKVKPLTL